jgi:hypothetical protein
VSLDPAHDEAGLGRARATDNIDEKLYCMRRVLDLDPENPNALLGLDEAQRERTGNSA